MQRCPTGQICGTGVPPVDYYYHTDDLYNVMAVTDGNGTVVERYEYGDYGTPLIVAPDGTVLGGSAIGNPYLFTGRRYDPESGWYNYRTRYLDPQSGKFATRDVIGIWGDPWEFGNGYAYVGNSPLSWFDPMGLSSICEILKRQRDTLEELLKWNPKIAACNLLCALKGGRRPPRDGEPGGISPPTMCKVEDAPFYFKKCVADCLKKYWGQKAETAGTTSPKGKITLRKNVLTKWPLITTLVIMRHELDHRQMVDARRLHDSSGGGGGGGGGQNSFFFGLEEVGVRFNDQDFELGLRAKIRYLEKLLGCDS